MFRILEQIFLKNLTSINISIAVTSLIVDLFVELIARDDRDNLKLITAWWKTNLIIICNSSWHDNYRFQMTRTLLISITIIVEKKYSTHLELILKKIEIILIKFSKMKTNKIILQKIIIRFKKKKININFSHVSFIYFFRNFERNFFYEEMNAFEWFITTLLNSHANGSKITVSRKHYDWELDRKFSWNQSRCKVERRRIWSGISF